MSSLMFLSASCVSPPEDFPASLIDGLREKTFLSVIGPGEETILETEIEDTLYSVPAKCLDTMRVSVRRENALGEKKTVRFSAESGESLPFIMEEDKALVYPLSQGPSRLDIFIPGSSAHVKTAVRFLSSLDIRLAASLCDDALLIRPEGKTASLCPDCRMKASCTIVFAPSGYPEETKRIEVKGESTEAPSCNARLLDLSAGFEKGRRLSPYKAPAGRIPYLPLRIEIALETEFREKDSAWCHIESFRGEPGQRDLLGNPVELLFI